jgi:radical SAM superfamily enzyme YgiQ (UPF0313 family)
MNKYQITPVFSFMIGIPGEKQKDIFKTIKLIMKLKKICPKMVGGISTFRPYPKCELSQELENKGYLTPPQSLKDWTKKENIDTYLEVVNEQKWQNPKTHLIAYYGRFLLSLNDQQIKEKIKKRDFKYIIIYLFRKITELRMRFLFFRFPLDKIILTKALEFKKRFRR